MLAGHRLAGARRVLGGPGAADDAAVFINKRQAPCTDHESILFNYNNNYNNNYNDHIRSEDRHLTFIKWYYYVWSCCKDQILHYKQMPILL